MKLNKKIGVIILFSVMLLVLTSISGLAVIDTDQILVYYSMDDHLANATHINDSSTPHYNGYTANSVDIGNTTAISNQSFRWDGNNDYVQLPINIIDNSNRPRSYSLWFYSPNNSSQVLIYRGRDSGGDVKIEIDDGIQNEWKCNGVWTIQTAMTYTTEAWHHFVATWNGTHLSEYIDGSLGHTDPCSAPLSINANTPCIGLNCIDNTQDYTGNIDEFLIYNESLTSAQVTELYNAGVGLFFPFVGGGGGGSDSINLSTPSPINLTEFKTNLINLNVSYNASESFNATLYINGTLNQTIQYPASTEGLINFTKVIISGSYTYFINAHNSDTDENTSNYNFDVDSLDFTGVRLPLTSATQYNNTVNFNYSVNASNNFTAYFFLDGVFNDSKSYLAGSEVFINFTKEVTEGQHSFYFIANNTNATETSFTNTFNVTTLFLNAGIQPLNNTQYSAEFVNFNLTFNTTTPVSCDLYFNNVFNSTNTTTTTGNNIPITFNIKFPANYDSQITFNFTCNNSNGANANSTQSTIFIDRIFPTITFYTPANDNSTQINTYNESLLTNITLFDANLYSYYYNISYSNGTIIYNVSKINITAKTYNVTHEINLSGINGTLFGTIKVCDGHTDFDVNFGSSIDNKEMVLSYANDYVKIYPENSNLYNSVDTTKLKDRYNFRFESKIPTNKNVFYVEAKEPILIYKTSEYKGHLVIGSKYWVDFENFNVSKVKVTQINPYKVKVEIDFKTLTKSRVFNSIGELNCRTVTRSFKTYYYFFENIVYHNFTAWHNNNYSRSLVYQINYSCSQNDNATLNRWVNDSLQNTINLTCNSTNIIENKSYASNQEGQYNITFYYNTSRDQSFTGWKTNNQSFISDLYNPTINLIQLNYSEGFNVFNATTYVRCNDSIMNNFTYNITWRGTNIYNRTTDNNTLISNETNVTQGYNNLSAVCSDLFGYNQENISTYVNIRQIVLIDEKLGTPFDVTNLSKVKVYFDDNSSYFDFKGNGTPYINFTGVTTNKLRFELVYSNGDVITRWVDTELDNGSLRVCANKEDVKHYEQLITSGTQRAVTVKSIFADCVIAEDYTRFAYQGSLILKAYTTEALYYLYTYDEYGTKNYLASMDGSISTYYNIDVLQFNEEAYNLAISGDGVGISNDKDTETVTIYYKNNQNESVSTLVNIYRQNDSTLYLTILEEDNPNEFYISFDYSTLDINETDMLRLNVQTTDSEGEVSLIKRYFNIGGQSGILSSGLALALAVLLTIFGLTLTTSRTAFGYFGFVITLLAIGVLSFAVSAWYISLFMVIEIIIGVFIILTTLRQNGNSILT